MRLVTCLGIVAVVAGLVGPSFAAPKHGIFPDEKLKVGNDTREFRLVVPKTVDLRKPAMLVIAFHGMLDSKNLMPAYTKLNDTARKHKFILVYPNGLERYWGIKPEKVKQDLAFFDVLLKKLAIRYRIDPKRIYVVGLSNGGYWSHLIGKERSKKVAAVASHSGPVWAAHALTGIKAARKFPVLIIHGKKDKLFPVAWARGNRDQYRREGHKVKYVEVPDLGHFWAGPKINETIIKFFMANPMK